jgi:hypothetical protein
MPDDIPSRVAIAGGAFNTSVPGNGMWFQHEHIEDLAEQMASGGEFVANHDREIDALAGLVKETEVLEDVTQDDFDLSEEKFDVWDDGGKLIQYKAELEDGFPSFDKVAESILVRQEKGLTPHVSMSIVGDGLEFDSDKGFILEGPYRFIHLGHVDSGAQTPEEGVGIMDVATDDSELTMMFDEEPEVEFNDDVQRMGSRVARMPAEMSVHVENMDNLIQEFNATHEMNFEDGMLKTRLMNLNHPELVEEKMEEENFGDDLMDLTVDQIDELVAEVEEGLNEEVGETPEENLDEGSDKPTTGEKRVRDSPDVGAYSDFSEAEGVGKGPGSSSTLPNTELHAETGDSDSMAADAKEGLDEKMEDVLHAPNSQLGSSSNSSSGPITPENASEVLSKANTEERPEEQLGDMTLSSETTDDADLDEADVEELDESTAVEAEESPEAAEAEVETEAEAAEADADVEADAEASEDGDDLPKEELKRELAREREERQDLERKVDVLFSEYQDEKEQRLERLRDDLMVEHGVSEETLQTFNSETQLEALKAELESRETNDLGIVEVEQGHDDNDSEFEQWREETLSDGPLGDV